MSEKTVLESETSITECEAVVRVLRYRNIVFVNYIDDLEPNLYWIPAFNKEFNNIDAVVQFIEAFLSKNE